PRPDGTRCPGPAGFRRHRWTSRTVRRENGRRSDRAREGPPAGRKECLPTVHRPGSANPSHQPAVEASFPAGAGGDEVSAFVPEDHSEGERLQFSISGKNGRENWDGGSGLSEWSSL